MFRNVCTEIYVGGIKRTEGKSARRGMIHIYIASIQKLLYQLILSFV